MAAAEPQQIPQPVKKKKILVAVHGIGDQLQCSTIQQVANQLCRFYGDPADIPLGQLHAKIISPRPPAPGPLDRIVLTGQIEDGMPLGEIPVTRVTAPPPPVPVYSIEGKKNFPDGEFNFGLTEIYWADIARAFAHDGYSLENTKAWGRTIVARARSHTNYLRDNGLAEEVVPQVIEGIQVLENVFFLADKAFGIKFDLATILRDYVGDVQQVAEFENIRSQILTAFQSSLNAIYSNNPDAEIYFFAHSEGTVVTFLALLTAIAALESDDKDKAKSEWVKNVRGLMTIGSPIDKHIYLWPELFKPFQNKVEFAKVIPDTIKWRNYYDFGDPVGFDLDDARKWLKKYHWTQYFEFTDKDDFGFARYVFPGKAHLDYFTDDQLFDHFLHNIVGLEPIRPTPNIKLPLPSRNVWGFIPVGFLATLIPYVLTFAVLMLGMYLFYRGASEYAPIEETGRQTARNVLALTILVWGLTFAASVVRVTNVSTRKTLGWQTAAYLVAVSGIVIAYQLLTEAALLRGVLVVPDSLRTQLGSNGLYAITVSGLLATVPLAVTTLQVQPKLRRWLCVIGVAAAVLVLFDIRLGDQSAYTAFLKIRGTDPNDRTDLTILRSLAAVQTFPGRILAVDETNEVEESDAPVAARKKHVPPPVVWPLLIGAAMLFYLWWLTIILLDLTILWHMYIRAHSPKDPPARKAARVTRDSAIHATG